MFYALSATDLHNFYDSNVWKEKIKMMIKMWQKLNMMLEIFIHICLQLALL